jgi:hypothetical protein
MREQKYSSIFLDLGTRWRSVVSFTPRLLYHRAKRPHYPLDRRLGGPQSQSGRHGEEIDFLLLPAIEPLPFSLHPVAIPTELDKKNDKTIINVHMRISQHSPGGMEEEDDGNYNKKL